jgi:phage shock protein A
MDKIEIETQIVSLNGIAEQMRTRLEAVERKINELQIQLGALDAPVNKQVRTIDRLSRNDRPVPPIV